MNSNYQGIHTFTPQQLVSNFSKKDKYWEKPVFKDFNTFGFHKIENARHLMEKPLPPHRKTFHDFFLITKGSIHRAKGIESYTVAANTFCFIPAHTITYNALGSSDVEGFMCHFDESIINFDHHPFLQKLNFLGFNSYPLVKISKEYMPVIFTLLKRIETEFQSNLPDKYMLIQSYLITLFLEINRFVQPEKSLVKNTSLAISEKYKKLLNQHIHTKQKVADYAEMLRISPNHLNKCLKLTTNRTASEWISEVLILEAKVLLHQTPLSIAEIAYKVGMYDQSYFGRLFKKSTGFTPSEYRKMIE